MSVAEVKRYQIECFGEYASLIEGLLGWKDLAREAAKIARANEGVVVATVNVLEDSPVKGKWKYSVDLTSPTYKELREFVTNWSCSADNAAVFDQFDGKDYFLCAFLIANKDYEPIQINGRCRTLVCRFPYNDN